MTDKTSYGLHPSVWRAMRVKSPGCCDIRMYDRDGNTLFEGFLYRYESRVMLPSGEFPKVSWKQTIAHLPPVNPDNMLGPSIIPIGVSFLN